MNIKWNKIFDWTIKDVSEPAPYRLKCPGADSVFMGYKVAVTYVHHGKFTTTFNSGEDNRTLSYTPTEAFKDAKTYYHKMREKTLKHGALQRT